MLDRRNDYFRIATLLVWFLTPLTLPGVMALRDLPVSEQIGRCYIRQIGASIELYQKQNQQYPSVIGGDTFANDYYLLGELRAQCFEVSTPSLFQFNFVSMEILYQQQKDTYALGGYYHYFLLDLFGLTRVCHYDQVTKDVACGFNNWIPFSSP